MTQEERLHRAFNKLIEELLRVKDEEKLTYFEIYSLLINLQHMLIIQQTFELSDIINANKESDIYK